MVRRRVGTSWRPFVDRASQEAHAFDELVGAALDGLPEQFASALSNVEIVVEDEPEDPGLLGLYRGVPLTHRDGGYAGVLPDRISIFRGPIERMARSPQDLKRIVRETVLHELAHHFGIDDDRLHELGRD
jgi:predicted Zn-dependent protease with MMP-like domain